MAWPSLVGAAAGVLDRAYLAAIQAKTKRKKGPESLSHAERMDALGSIARAYDGIPTDVFFPAPPAPAPTMRAIRAGVTEGAWPSASTPYLGDVADRWLAFVENRTARARFYTRPGSHGRPVILLIHGYMGGSWIVEENQWPIEWLVRRGMDVILPLLPLHGARGGARRGPPRFPSSDPRLTIEGFRQAVTDLRSMVRWARERGAPKVGVMGMSLGGYTTALVASVVKEAEIDFAVPIIPLASIADFAREQGRLGEGHEAEEQHSAVERAHRIVSPFARPPVLPSSRLLIVAAEHDRITPTRHARRLADHMGCDLRLMPGGHLLQVGRSDAFRAVGRMLEREGIIARR
jgi:pimeloyl-ACP methyl ester carboxylesterase